MKLSIAVILILGLSAGFLYSQENVTEKKLTGSLYYDIQTAPENAELQSSVYRVQNETKKNPVVSAALSAAIPGAGQIYNGEWWKAAIFIAAEAALITTAVVYNKKGDDKTNEFEAYADQHWSVVKYAQWLMQHKTALGLPPESNIIIDPNTSLKPWERVDWTSLNFAEGKFSHKLPRYGEQQYYELIGKYPQYNHGWADQLDDNTPEYNSNLTAMFLGYSKMRGEANDMYNISSRMVVFTVINHILSAAEAAWASTIVNKSLSMNMRVQPIYANAEIHYQPTLFLSYSF